MKPLMTAAAVALLAGFGASTAFAADLLPTHKAPPPPPPVDDWHFSITLDGWMPSVATHVGILNLPTATSHIGFFDLLRHLDGIVPLSVEAHNRQFIIGADLFWSRLGTSASFGPGTFGGVNASATLNQTFATAYGGLALPLGVPNLSVYGIVGARYFNVNTTINLGVPVIGFFQSNSQGKDWVDEIVGLKAHYKIDDKWFVSMEADGGGYSGSGTWQVYPAIGYNWNPSITTTLGFRALNVYRQDPARFGSGSFRLNETMYGPEADISYNF